MITYSSSITLKTERIITKDDIITICKLLNNRVEYSNLCEFKPEGITEGGIVFNFKDSLHNKWYKTVRLCVNRGNSRGKWYWVNENVMSEWYENNDIIFDKNNKFNIFLKSFYGAPLFTLDELKIWEECFNQIGIVKVDNCPCKTKKPTKKRLFIDEILNNKILEKLKCESLEEETCKYIDVNNVDWHITKFSEGKDLIYEVFIQASNTDYLQTLKISKVEFRKKHIHKTCFVYKKNQYRSINKNNIKIDNFIFNSIIV